MSKNYNKIYVLCNKDKETDRYNHLINKFDEVKLQHYEFFNYIWGDEITADMRKKYCKSDYTMKLHGRNMVTKPLSNGEISLFLNNIECLKKIKREYTDGLFIIMESDVIFEEDFNNKFDKLIGSIKELQNWDIINIGNRKQWMNKKDYYHNKPIIINGIYFYREKINRCTEAIVWNYKSICKFLEYFEEKEDIDGPIDTKMDVFSEYIGGFNIYWNEPTFITQGSSNGIFKSLLRY